MSDLVGNPEDRFSHNEAELSEKASEDSYAAITLKIQSADRIFVFLLAD